MLKALSYILKQNKIEQLESYFFSGLSGSTMNSVLLIMSALVTIAITLISFIIVVYQCSYVKTAQEKWEGDKRVRNARL